MSNTIKDLAQLIKDPATKSAPKPYDTTAMVKRIEGDTVWVSIPGGVDETPISKTINCSEGDTVQVRVSGGRAWIVGNASAPPTDDKAANQAQETANTAQTTADEAVTIAEEAQSAAESVNQYFWHTETDTGAGAGAHITEIPQADFLADPTNGGGNLLGQSTGISVRDGLTDLATFGSSGVQIGQKGSGKSRTEIGTSGMQIIQNVSGTDTAIANLGYGPGNDSGGGTSDAPYYTLGVRAGTVGNYSVAEGYSSEASGYMAHAEATSTANGQWAHSEGASTASGAYSHSEGTSTASGNYSHAQGDRSTSSGTYSFASGGHATASSDYANSIGCYTTADSLYQTVVGKYNHVDSANTYSLIVGNGTATYARSNALTVDWGGNVVAAGDITAGGKLYAGAVNFTSFFTVEAESITVSASGAGNQSKTKSVTKAGYTPVGVVGTIVSTTGAYSRGFYLTDRQAGSCTLNVRLHTTGSGNKSCTAYIMWVKTTA